jgi:ribonuclease HI
MSNLKDISIYTHGFCTTNPGPGGYGVVMVYKNNRRVLSGGFSRTTKSRMEIQGAIIALENLNQRCNTTIYTDSVHLVDTMREGWVKRWRDNDWKRNKVEAVRNQDLWEKLQQLCDVQEVDFEWIKDGTESSEIKRCIDIASVEAQRQDLPVDSKYEEFKPMPHINNLQTEEHVVPIEIKLDGKKYIWSDGEWFGAENKKQLEKVLPQLNKEVSSRLIEEDSYIDHIPSLLKRALNAREHLQLERLEKLANGIIKIEPSNYHGMAILCGALRDVGLPVKALAKTALYKGTNNHALLTSRAAAYCDLGQWAEAKQTINRALAIERSNAAYNVAKRIKYEYQER